MMPNVTTKHGPESSQIDEQQKPPIQQQQVPSTGILPAHAESVMRLAQLELGPAGNAFWQAQAAYPYPEPFYGSYVATYGAQAMIPPHMLGVQQGSLPLPPSDMVEEPPVYVNAKQYRGILRRRQSRAKAESENKLIKCRKTSHLWFFKMETSSTRVLVKVKHVEDKFLLTEFFLQPYLHESRHRHALRRARGCGGRFLNTKNDGSNEKDVSGDNDSHDSTGQSNKVLNPDSGKDGTSHDLNGIQHIGNLAQIGSGISGHSVTVFPGQVGVGESLSNGSHYTYNQRRGFHSSAFHPLSVSNSESGQVGGVVSSGGHHTAVATQ